MSLHPPIDGCTGCASTAGRAGCPLHGPAGVATATAVGHRHLWRTDKDEWYWAIQTCSDPGCGAVRRVPIEDVR